MKLELTNPNTIENANGQIRMLTGPKAIECMRLRTIITGLHAEANGMRLTRGVNCTKLAKEVTGLKTRDRVVLEARLNEMIQANVRECQVITDGQME